MGLSSNILKTEKSLCLVRDLWTFLFSNGHSVGLWNNFSSNCCKKRQTHKQFHGNLAFLETIWWFLFLGVLLSKSSQFYFVYKYSNFSQFSRLACADNFVFMKNLIQIGDCTSSPLFISDWSAIWYFIGETRQTPGVNQSTNLFRFSRCWLQD